MSIIIVCYKLYNIEKINNIHYFNDHMAFNRWEGQNKYFGSSYNSEGYGYYHSKKKGKRSYYGNSIEYNSYNKEKRNYSNWHYKPKYSGFGAYHEKYAYSETDETKENMFNSSDTISQTSSKSTEQYRKMNTISRNSDVELKPNVNKDSNKEGKLWFENPYQIINSKVQKPASRRTESFDYTYRN